MFFHNFKYTLKVLFKNKMLLFWTLFFPIILGTLFYMAFMDIEKKEAFSLIDIAIVDNLEFQNDLFFKETFKELGDNQNEESLFRIQYVREEEARKLLEDSSIDGYLKIGEEAEIFVLENGVNETIFKRVVEEILENKKTYAILVESSLEKQDPSFLSNIIEKILTGVKKANILDVSSKHLSYTMIEFYTLIAMTALYGAILTVWAMQYQLANISSIGKRVSISMAQKIKMLSSSLLASFLIQLVGLFLLFVYTIFVLHVDYGTNFPLVLLLALVGSFAGLSLGIFVGVLKVGENIKTGLVISFTMLGCFLSGMMGITMKYLVDKHVPLLNQINPVNLITDGFYSLYYYDTYTRYFKDVVGLFLFSFLFLLLAIQKLRRQKYDSI